MKKIIITIVILLQFQITFATKKIEKAQPVIFQNGRTEAPIIEYDNNTGVLKVDPNNNNALTLRLDNEYGETECEQEIMNGGTTQTILLPRLEPGLYNVTLENTEVSYEATLNIQ